MVHFDFLPRLREGLAANHTPCGVPMGQTYAYTPDWALVTCKRCLSRQSLIMSRMFPDRGVPTSNQLDFLNELDQPTCSSTSSRTNPD